MAELVSDKNIGVRGLRHWGKEQARCARDDADGRVARRFLSGGNMLVTTKGRVTIPKQIRIAAGVEPGSKVSFRLEGKKIVITPLAKATNDDRRAKLREAAARVQASLKDEFKQLSAEEIMNFLRGELDVPPLNNRGRT